MADVRVSHDVHPLNHRRERTSESTGTATDYVTATVDVAWNDERPDPSSFRIAFPISVPSFSFPFRGAGIQIGRLSGSLLKESYRVG